jgi:hypothetical protein
MYFRQDKFITPVPRKTLTDPPTFSQKLMDQRQIKKKPSIPKSCYKTQKKS